jgi:uncharacterized damage-inducible protein DinB
MASAADVLIDAFDRVHGTVHRVLGGLEHEQLAARLDPAANSIAWLIWHLTRGQDVQLADAAGTDELWRSGGWADRFDLPFSTSASGYGQSAKEVGQVGEASTVTAELLGEYFDAVHQVTVAYVSSLSETDLDRIVDTNWNPPVTLAVRLVSMINDATQHAGQAAFIKGVIGRR